MHEMKKKTIAGLAVQVVAALFGVVGVTWVGLGLHFAVSGIRESDLFQMCYMTPMFLLLGGIVIAVAWQALRHFGPKAIQGVVGLIAFSVYTSISMLLRPFQDATWDLKMRLHHSATFLIPMLLAYLLYRVVSRKLIELTEAEGMQQEAGEATSDSAPGAEPEASQP